MEQLERVHKRVKSGLRRLKSAFYDNGHSLHPPQISRRAPQTARRNVNINNTIRALRAKAADPSVTEAEAAAFAAKADALCERHGPQS